MEPTLNIALLVAIRKRGWRQVDFAREVGDHFTFVSRVVNGHVILDKDHKKRYAKALRAKVHELFPD
jgi:ribosome-binding protein aMBF1 (putative translation factor)